VSEQDQRIWQLFLAGASYSQIASAVGCEQAAVDDVVRCSLDATGARRDVLTRYALAVHVERVEALFRAHWTAALRGDHKATDTCRKLLEQQTKMYELGMSAPPAPDGEDHDEESDTFDELARRRTGRGADAPCAASSERL
jgi:hypothetical protein